jgi:nicotinate-nucleotide adenylyltransferase
MHRTGHTVHYLAGIPLDISSSAIRDLAGHNRSFRYLVPPTVEQYIFEKRLYADVESE